MGIPDIREVLLGLFYGYKRKKPKRSEKRRLKKLKSKKREHELLVAVATRFMNSKME